MTPSLDYSGHSLQNRSFQGQDLNGVSFRNADIRSTNFNDAILTGADFSNARAGSSYRASTILIITALFHAVLTAFFSVQIAAMEIVMMQQGELTAISASLIVLIMLPLFSITTVCKGLGTALAQSFASFISAMTMPLFMAWIGALRGIPTGAVAGIAPGAIATFLMLVGAGIFSISISVAGMVSIGWALVITMVGIFFILASIAGGLGFIAAALIDPTQASTEALTRQALSNPEAIPSLGDSIKAVAGSALIGGSAVIVGAATIAGLGCYLGWRVLAGDARYASLRQVAINLCAIGGTKFKGADLVDANFTRATVKGTNFRLAKLTRTCWIQVQGMDFACFENSELDKAGIRNLVVTGQGSNQNFDRQNLSGLQLASANFQNTCFINTDLSGSNLEKADLSGAILVRSQLDAANLTGANLTGACIEDWSITKTTKIQGIICKYIYLQWVNTDKRERLPTQGEFKHGDFVRFLQTLRNTVDLYHTSSINPRAAVASLAELSAEYGEPLEILVLEQRPNTTNAVIKLKNPTFVNNEEAVDNLKKNYLIKYEVFLKQRSLNTSHLKEQIAEISQRLRDPTHIQTITIGNIENNGGIIITGGTTNLNTTLTQSLVSADAEIDKIVLKLESEIDMIPDSQFSKNYKCVLTKLKEALIKEPEITSVDKSDVLEQILILSGLWRDRRSHTAIRQAQKSIYILQGLIDEYENAEIFRQACHLLLKPLMTLLKHED